MLGTLSGRRALLLRPILSVEYSSRSLQVWKVKKAQYDFDKLCWRQYKKKKLKIFFFEISRKHRILNNGMLVILKRRNLEICEHSSLCNY